MRKVFKIGLLAAGMGMMAMAASATGAAARPKMLSGIWGGDRMILTMSPTGGTIRMDCANGTIKGKIIPNAKGQFTASGTFDQQHGGPTRAEDFVAGGRPATFRGQIVGETIKLSIIESGSAGAQSYVLIKGKSEKLVRCL
jgi:hypothetical protein